MSLELQKRLRQRRQFGSTRTFDRQVYADQYILSHMILERELPGHTGCVNTLDWSLGGDKLLTGSDDTKLNIYLPFENYEIATTIDTGHRANIFTAKFMPQTSDNIILSGAGDSEIRIFDLTNPENQLDSMYVCHSDQLKKICVYNDNPFEFMTCSQDGTVRHFDRRTPHKCSSHNVRSFITAQNKPARQHPIPKGKDVRIGCSNPVVDYSRYNIELNSMSISKLFPHYFAVAGMNDYIYLHDSRMTMSGTSASQKTSTDMTEKLKCVKRFSPTLDGLNRPEKHITACKFSDTNGYELLGSWSSDGVYLFNINDDTVQSSAVNNTSACTSRSISNLSALSALSSSASPSSPSTSSSNNDMTDVQDFKKTEWEVLFELMEYNLESSCLSSFHDYLERNRSDLDLDGRIGLACLSMVEAHLVCRLRENRDDWYSSTTVVDDPDSAWSRYFFEHELTKIQQKMQDAEAMLLPTYTWQAYWCLGIGHWVLRGGHKSIGDLDRKASLDKSLEYVNKAIDTFKQAEQEASSSPLEEMDNGTYLTMMELFVMDWQHAAIREGHLTIEEAVIPPDTISNWPWEKLMYITLYNPSDIQDFFASDLEQPTEMESANDGTRSSSSHITTTSNSSLAVDEDEQMTEEDVSLYTRIMSRQIMDIYRGGSVGDDSEDSDLDLDELAVLRESTQQVVEADVGVVKPRMKYTGHSNIETIKDVDFFGPNDEYIVSGSDGGYLFIWDKKSSKILQILQADGDIVNVAKGHPTLPILAVSGIDSTTKIFTPTSKPHSTLKSKEPNNPNSYSASSHLYEEQDIVSLNRENNQTLGSDIYITRSMIAALSRISRQHRMRRSNNDDDNVGLDENERESRNWLFELMEDSDQ